MRQKYKRKHESARERGRSLGRAGGRGRRGTTEKEDEEDEDEEGQAHHKLDDRHYPVIELLVRALRHHNDQLVQLQLDPEVVGLQSRGCLAVISDPC